LQVPFQEERGAACYHILPVLLPERADRRRFMDGMKVQGIQTSMHYPPVHHFQIYRPCLSRTGRLLTVTEAAARREVTLPLYPTMQPEQVEWVVQAARDVLAEMK
jgi:dTDP-4-amino-4,6-dideoxygalactose transaminase